MCPQVLLIVLEVYINIIHIACMCDMFHGLIKSQRFSCAKHHWVGDIKMLRRHHPSAQRFAVSTPMNFCNEAVILTGFKISRIT